MRHLLGVPEEESLQSFVEHRGSHLRASGERALRSLERLLQGLGIAPPPHADLQHVARGETRVARPEPTKFDLGPAVDRTPVREQIPWSYGENRVTGMPVDPDRMFVYWEVRDDAIADARRGLGAGGEGAWLSLRVYDVTGRIFDGSNAHAYFDHRVERHDRQWFFDLGRPGSTVCVDVGMKSLEGFFVKIARSGRVDLPRAAEAPPGGVEWMSVHAESGAIEPASGTTGAPAAAAGTGRAGSRATAPAADEHGADESAAPAPPARSEIALDQRTHALTTNGWHEITPGAWHEIPRRSEWVGDVERTTWQAGPFPQAVAPPVYEVTEERSGGVQVVESPQGRVVIEGPWSVTIRGIGAHLTRRVLGRWQIVRALPAAVSAIAGDVHEEHVTLGGSEVLARRGASELRFGAASEVRLAGASEEFLLGASELRLRGASERFFFGASERRYAGASERMRQGASEWLHGGASERLLRGASELRLGGASERQLAGASEHRLARGASEGRLASAVTGERSARASWQAFADAGSRLTARAAEADAVRDATLAPAPDAAPREDDTSGARREADAEAGADDGAAPAAPRW